MDALTEIQFSAITIMNENAANENRVDIQTSGLGDPIPRFHGRVITSGNIFWLENNTVLTQTWNNEEAKFATFALGLGINVGNGRGLAVTRIWAQGRRIFNILTDKVSAIDDRDGLVFTGSGCYAGHTQIKGLNMSFQFYPGTLIQPKCPIIIDADGDDMTPRFPSLCYIVFTNFPLYHYDNDLANLDLKVELVKIYD